MTLANPPSTLPHPTSPILEVLSRAAVVPLTVEQYLGMIEKGIVSEDSSIELLRGVLIRKDRSVIGEDPMGHSPLHVMVVSLLTALATRINCLRWYLQIQLPVLCPPDGAPEPDAAIVAGSPRDYRDRLPAARDVSCVIEAAHSSLERDREDKLPIYAAAGVPQLVIINLQNDTIEIYSDPDPAQEQYRTRVTRERGQTVLLRLNEGSFEVAAAELLP